ncbi:UNKNOWN [Stylonychia lemnae]|uniref:Uncharacterized protein n=1 Tax=Stylonychia lemnae TaxID=5949 RepID=A0A078A2X6_STYLE|nr:UNKNOWN [Stylonychia lemnae]|eukprot:CDW76470.1 UNKNOWN [Stylonychia lemnae]
MGCSASQLEMVGAPGSLQDERPWLKINIPLVNAKVSSHHHVFPLQEIRDSGWRCSGRESFPMGCLGGINDFHISSQMPGYKCSDYEKCDFDFCKYCMMYSYHIDNTTAKLTGRWTGYVEMDGVQKQLTIPKFVMNEGIIKGQGIDEIGEYDINGIYKELDCKFNKIGADKKLERYFGTLKIVNNERKIIGNYLVDDKKGKFELKEQSKFSKQI